MSFDKTSQRFIVSGVCCSTEESLIRKTMNNLAGADGYQFNPVTCELKVRGDVNQKGVTEALVSAGFGVRIQETGSVLSLLTRHRQAVIVAIAIIFGLAGIALKSSESLGVLPNALFFTGILLSGWNVFKRAFTALRSRVLDMNVLMTVAVAGAIAIDRWEEGAVVMVLFSIALLLESYSMERTRKAIRSLMTAAPDEAIVVRNNAELSIRAEEVQPGEHIIIKPGMRIPLDGVVVSGFSTVNQSAVTGESQPVNKSSGDVVYAGSLNDRGEVTIRVTHRYKDSTLAHISHFVEEAHQKRAPVHQTVDRFARLYTPVVLALAALIAIVPPFILFEPFGEWFYRALVLLVISCPCALVLSTPVAMISAINTAARHGVLVKGGRQIQVLSSVRSLVFDKTGTLTEGKPSVTDIIPLNSLSPMQIISTVASLEARSEHHLASAILAEAKNIGGEERFAPVEGFMAVPGRGVTGTVNGTTYYAGNHEFCEEHGGCSLLVENHLARIHGEGKTSMVFGKKDEPIAILGIADKTREQSAGVVRVLGEQGINPIVILSGDDQHIANRFADRVGVSHVYGGLLPADKVRRVERLKEEHGNVAMVGDGINDAPALASSSVGIAMGVSGTDAALESADVVLMADDLEKLPFLFRLSRKTMSIVRQNIAVALGLKMVFFLLTVFGMSTLWMAVLADDGATLLVIFNAFRVLRMDG